MAKSYTQLMVEAQCSLFAFIFSLVGDSETANDVLQEANLVLWEKESEYDTSRPFRPWAYKISYLQVLSHRERAGRDRLVFDDELIHRIAGGFPTENDSADERRDALNKCVQQLKSRESQLVRMRYFQSMSLSAIAAQCGMSLSSVKVALYRTRKMLADCVERKLTRREGAA